MDIWPQKNAFIGCMCVSRIVVKSCLMLPLSYALALHTSVSVCSCYLRRLCGRHDFLATRLYHDTHSFPSATATSLHIDIYSYYSVTFQGCTLQTAWQQHACEPARWLVMPRTLLAESETTLVTGSSDNKTTRMLACFSASRCGC
jgi:hypothetical protein